MKKQKFYVKLIDNGDFYLKSVGGYIFKEDSRLFMILKTKYNPFKTYALVDIKTGVLLRSANSKEELLQKYYDVKIKYDNIVNEKWYKKLILEFNELLNNGKILEVEEE